MERLRNIFGQVMPKKAKFQYASIIVALVLVGQFSDIQNSVNIVTMRTVENIAGVVGMGASVPPNESNLLAQALEERKTELDEREKEIDAKEREIRAIVIEETAKQNRITLYVIAGVTLFLVLLIVLNFYLDTGRVVTPVPPRGGTTEKGDPHAHEGEFTTKL